MIKFKLRDCHFREKKADYIVCEVDEQFSPLPGSGVSVWKIAGKENLSTKKPVHDLRDCEIIETQSFRLRGYPCGILHLMVPLLSDSSDGKESLRKCYAAILEKAVLLNARKIMLPFVGVLSREFSAIEGVDVALRYIHDFISNGANSGKLKQITICCDAENPAYQAALTHELYHKMTEDNSCIFSNLDLSFESARAEHRECKGKTQKLRKLSGRNELFGCANVIDLLLLRGGIQVDWNDEARSRVISGMYVCVYHKTILLTNWKANKYANKNRKMKPGQFTCSLPEIQHEGDRPLTTRRLNKLDTLNYIEATGRFIHVGTAVCTPHEEDICQEKFDKLLFKKRQSNSQESLPDDFMTPGEFSENQSEAESNTRGETDASMDGQSMSDDSEPVNTPQLPATVGHTEQNKEKALRDCAISFGINRFTSKDEWDNLHPDTQRKKINAFIAFMDEMFKLVGGSSWQNMKTAFLRKMKLVENDTRVESVMDVVGQCLEDSSVKSVRISVLKLLAGVFTEKEIREGTGASRYLIRQAKLTSFDEVHIVNKFHKDKYKEEKVDLILRFIARPEIIITMPNICKKFTLGNGNEASIAAVARLYSYREIYNLFIKYCEELARQNGKVTDADVAEYVRVNALGFSSAYKLMKVLASVRQLRMSCIDAFQAAAFDAFEELSGIVDELSTLDVISMDKTMELRRRIRVAKNFIFGEMRMHISQEDEVISHCWSYALNDGTDSRFLSPCKHQHKKSCTECSEAMALSNVLKGVVEPQFNTAKKNDNSIKYPLGRMLELCSESEEHINAYRQHLMRCAASEHDRRKIIDGLLDGHALIVADYAMKLLPTDAIENQSKWYAKAGISFHMCATVARINGQLASHSFSHVSPVPKQDAVAVAGILKHAMEILKSNGVTHLHYRTDNAANYHCAPLIASIFHFAEELKMTVISHIFSEPQFGKGRADREISLVKGKLNSFIDSGHSASTPTEIINGFTHNILLKGCSFYLIEVTEVPGGRKAALKNIKQFSSFRFQKGVGVRVRKHDSLGDGMIVNKNILYPIKFTTTINRSAGYGSQTEHFWKMMGTANGVVEEKVKEMKPALEEEQGKKEFLRCSDMLCHSKFKTERGRQLHELKEKHEYYKETKSMKDYAVEAFSNLIESTEEAQMAVHTDSLVPLSSGDQAEVKKIGWALRKKEETRERLDHEVKKEVEMMIEMQLDGKQRAEAREIRNQLRIMKNANGSYRFPLVKCLSESQIKSQITRILKNRKNNNEGSPVENGQSGTTTPTARGKKRKEPQMSNEKEKAKRGRPAKKAQEDQEEEEEEEEMAEVEEVNDEELAVEEEENDGEVAGEEGLNDEEEEEASGDEEEEELNLFGIMKLAVDQNHSDIFDVSDNDGEISDEF